MASTCTEEEEIDPRIKLELERLNTATDEINSMELQLDEARASFRQSLTESTHSLNAISKKLGSCIEKARPYYEARQKAKECQQETQKAAVRFERANSMLAAAKEMVDLAEQGLIQEGRKFDANWQEMLNHATMKVGEAEHEKRLSEKEHMNTASEFHRVEQHLKHLQKSLRRTINKSRPYFEMKNKLNQQLEDKKKRVEELQERVTRSKEAYSNALHNLEQISDEIHEQRRYQAAKLGERGTGVGAESTPMHPSETPESPTKYRHSYPFDLIPLAQCQETPSSPKGFLPELLCRDDTYVRAPKLRMLRRPLSLQESDLSPPDPHSILRAFESVDKLDEMSDTASCYSCDNLDDDISDRDSALGTPGHSRQSSFNGKEMLEASIAAEAIQEQESTPTVSLEHPLQVESISDEPSERSQVIQGSQVTQGSQLIPGSQVNPGSQVAPRSPFTKRSPIITLQDVPAVSVEQSPEESNRVTAADRSEVTQRSEQCSEVNCQTANGEIDEENGSLV
ncbi:SH3 domain-binding protein 5-like [Patiria miniata]|uniref:SH3 domain-binding protein 5-like n=1 Tax=Patiria miniata TaxID=46514 RepID=A0A913ZIV9_PATMI|nr:SH3 domain-binding protein 5-like [Patiria miniata]